MYPALFEILEDFQEIVVCGKAFEWFQAILSFDDDAKNFAVVRSRKHCGFGC